MTNKDIIDRIDEIKKYSKFDDESAHVLEKELQTKFIEYVAWFNNSIGEKARLVLTTKSIDFERWYAQGGSAK